MPISLVLTWFLVQFFFCVCVRAAGGGRCELHRSLLTQGLWGMAHTWKHFRASLHCNWAYYHNYSFKAPAICIKHAPAQPPGLWPCGTTGPLLLSTHSPLSLHFILLVFPLSFSFSTFSGYSDIRGERGLRDFVVLWRVKRRLLCIKIVRSSWVRGDSWRRQRRERKTERKTSKVAV